MSVRSKLGVWKYNVKRQVMQTIITEGFGVGTRRLIVFLTPGFDSPNGGIMSIASIYRESAALQRIHGARVAMCTLPGDPPLLKYTWFKNHDYLLELETLLARCRRLNYLLVHIPEYVVNRVADWFESQAHRLPAIDELHFNIMVQHIDLVEGQDLKRLARFGKVTCTTAHESYTNAATRARLGIPLHRLSVYFGPERYSHSDYVAKRNVLMVSHDDHPSKRDVLSKIERAVPELEIRVIENMPFEKYLELARNAKWSLTFGEGLDSYFCDPVFNGGVSFAVFNDRFFTPEFAKLETVYESWQMLSERITDDLRRLDEPVAYKRCWQQARELLDELYSAERFRENLRAFYQGDYTFP